MPTNPPITDHSAQERIIADAIVDVATELRLADPIEFLAMIRAEHAANIADLVNSSSELFFKSGALRYALAAGCEMGWETTPKVCLDMEFRHSAVTVFFRLTIGRARAGVEVLDIFFDDGSELTGLETNDRLARAIADARLQ